MAKVQTLTDEELLKRSARAGWYLMALAAAMTVLAVWMVVVAALAEAVIKPDSAQSGMMWIQLLALPLAACAATVGLWLLAVAARRGSPTAPGVVLGVLAIQILFAFITSCNALMHGIVATSLVYLIVYGIFLIGASIACRDHMEGRKPGDDGLL